MGLIYLALYKGRGTLFNRLVRLWTRSKYSHCELVLADGRWLSASAMDGGVRAKHIELNLEHWDLIPLPWADYRQIARVFRANAGQGYDFFGLFGSQLLPNRPAQPASLVLQRVLRRRARLPHAATLQPGPAGRSGPAHQHPHAQRTVE